jgi:hypothetical protein
VSFCVLFLLFLVNYVSVLLKSFIIFCSLVLHLLYFAEKSQEFVTKPMSRWRSCIGPVIHLAAYKRRQSLQCHSDFNNSSKTESAFSLHHQNESNTTKNPEKAQEYDEHIHHLQNPNRFSTTQSTQIRVKFLINFTIQQQNSPRTNQTVSNSQSIASRFNKIVSNFRDSQRFFKESSSSNLRILPAIPTVR